MWADDRVLSSKKNLGRGEFPNTTSFDLAPFSRRVSQTV